MQNYKRIVYKRNSFVVFLIILLLSNFGCAQHHKIIHEAAPPIFFKGKSDLVIDIVDVQVDQSLMNKIIGYYHEGYSFIKPVTYYGYHVNFPKSVYISDLKSELRSANYPVTESSASLFNKTDPQPQKKADLLIGGTIILLNFDSYSYAHRRNSKANVVVKWEVFDNNLKTVIYQKKTAGSATGPFSLTDVQAVTIVGAVQSSFKNILCDREFVNAVDKSLKNKQGS